MATTASPISIYFTDGAQPESSSAESATQASSIHTQFALRERYDFMWDNASQRDAQTGMVQGSRGYQVDTKTEYLYDNGEWRFALSYAEYNKTAVQSIPNVTETSIINMSLVTGASTDATFTTVNGATGAITITNPGVYALSLVVGMSGALGTTNYAAFRPDTTGTAPPMSLSAFNAGSTTVSVPFLRTTVPNYLFYPRMYQSGGAAANTLYAILRIGRLG